MKVCTALLLTIIMVVPGRIQADEVPVRYMEGLAHGFMILRQENGTKIADGELEQFVQSGRVRSHLVFRFKDGSLYDDLTEFAQHRTFRLLSDRVIQKGPSFKTSMESSIDGMTGQVSVSYTENGQKKSSTVRLDLPPDVANGLIFTLLKNVKLTPVSFSYVATTPKPKLVKLVITRAGDEPFVVDDRTRHAAHFIVKVQIGGIAGIVAPVVGKQPPDTHIWILDGEAPTFVGSEGPLYGDGPIWHIGLTSPIRKQNIASVGKSSTITQPSR